MKILISKLLDNKFDTNNELTGRVLLNIVPFLENLTDITKTSNIERIPVKTGDYEFIYNLKYKKNITFFIHNTKNKEIIIIDSFDYNEFKNTPIENLTEEFEKRIEELNK